MNRDPRVDAYIAGRAPFAQPILSWLRERFHAAVPEAEETIKWSHPFFTLGGKPFANMASFKAHASFGFWNRQDNETGREGEGMGQFGRIESLADLPDAAEVERLIREAAAKLGESKPARPRAAPKGEAEVPPELAEALAADDAAAATFDGFPPSCRREYCDWIAEAKRPETRAKRVGDAVAWMREGKRRNWKYENC
ncbi:YdeI/OmpD-associated family protein [Sphingomonas sp. HITSZ_GF]|uniref:YdeI/OmpD-associated family protein n=1 Tax=Sphingomonas sp. HITSZ_GF TaxID=3037247 RepID=UPI00240E6FBB|nr:YdeI/OmpD-associated family protein [Sphingomonas sp. HITSZ_GF]MDG2533278.1 YdeI/OmpD-associated family protein [Sphingomonas sp. HITSZ_GF]